MANARVQQAVIELMTLTEPNAKVQQAVIELMVLPIVATSPISVILRGVKRFPITAPPSICPVDKEEHEGLVKKLTEWIG
jgi:hypothetical protein